MTIKKQVSELTCSILSVHFEVQYSAGYLAIVPITLHIPAQYLTQL
ncbi:hypothetical protein ACROAK_04995 [Shewanella oncorhynchi]